MLKDLLIHGDRSWNKGAWLLETNLVMRRHEISDVVVLKMLILQLNRKDRGKQYLLLLLKHLKIPLHHHFVDSSVSTATTSILT
jgi:hypothetical protein